MEEKKMTKKDYFEEIKTVLEDAKETALAEVMAHEIALLENKAIKNKERAEARKIAGDELRDTISNILIDDLQTVDEIVEQIDDEEITKGKVVARLTQLVNLNEAIKEQIKIEDGKKVMAYRRA